MLERKDLLMYEFYSKISMIVFSGAVDDEKLTSGKIFYFASLSKSLDQTRSIITVFSLD
jgi:hypothetical protein